MDDVDPARLVAIDGWGASRLASRADASAATVAEEEEEEEEGGG